MLGPPALVLAWLFSGGYDCVRSAIFRQALFSAEFAGASGAAGVSFVLTVDFNHDGTLLAAGGINNAMAVWEIPRGEVRCVRDLSSTVQCVRFLPGANSVIACTDTGLFVDFPVRVWDARSGRVVKMYAEQPEANSLAISPDGRWVAFPSRGDVRVLDAQTGAAVTTLTPGAELDQVAAAFSPDGRLLAVGGYGVDLAAVLTWWDVGEWKLAGRKEWPCPRDPVSHRRKGPMGFGVRALDYSPDGRYLAVAGEAAPILLFDPHMQVKRRLAGHRGWTTALAFTPDSRQLVSGGSDMSVKVWEVATGRCLRTMRRHWGQVQAVAASPDGRRIASASNDGTVRLWDLGSGRCRKLLSLPSVARGFDLPSNPAAGQTFTNTIEGTELIFIPGGTFEMGGKEEHDGKPIHDLEVEDFWLGKHEVTNEQYRKFVEATGHREPRHWHENDLAGPTQPVVGIDWHDAVAYCKWARGRLPTEAEWEYAARGGKQYEYGTATGELSHDLANYEGIGGKDQWEKTAPVGSFPANPLGLYDMTGNVFEWCSSEYRPYPYSADDGREDLRGKTRRVLRGGAFCDPSENVRCACRHGGNPIHRANESGFRLCATTFERLWGTMP